MSECAAAVPDLLAHFRGWNERYEGRSVHGLWKMVDPGIFVGELQVVPAGERKPLWHRAVHGLAQPNVGRGTITLPNEKMAAAAIVQARDVFGLPLRKTYNCAFSAATGGRLVRAAGEHACMGGDARGFD